MNRILLKTPLLLLLLVLQSCGGGNTSQTTGQKADTLSTTVRSESGRYVFNNGQIVIELAEESDYRIFENGELSDSGHYETTQSDGEKYIQMKEIPALYHNDTLTIQNTGNAMNPYQRFDSAEEKYMDFIKDAANKF